MPDDYTAETGAGGWCRFVVAGLPGPLLLRFSPDADGGRLRVRELYLAGGEPLEARHLRRLPLARMEATANRPIFRRQLERELGEGDLAGPLADATALGLAEDTFDVVPRSRRSRKPLRRPEGRVLPDGFYRDVGERYQAAVERGEAPAPLIASEAGVPASTAHRWVKEARRRGLLPQATQGRAG